MNYVPVDDQIVNIRQIVRKCPPVTLRRAFMRAAAEWCRQTQWLRETLPGESESDTPTYTLGDDPDLDILGIRDLRATNAQGKVFTLQPADPLGWNPNIGPDFPRAYAYLAEGQFTLLPTPDANYTLSLTLIVAPKETSANVPASILKKYSGDIEAGALAYLLSIPGEPWHDPAGAQRYAHDFASGISNGKADVQRAYNTGSMRVRPRAFLTGPGGWRA